MTSFEVEFAEQREKYYNVNHDKLKVESIRLEEEFRRALGLITLYTKTTDEQDEYYENLKQNRRQYTWWMNQNSQFKAMLAGLPQQWPSGEYCENISKKLAPRHLFSGSDFIVDAIHYIGKNNLSHLIGVRFWESFQAFVGTASSRWRDIVKLVMSSYSEPRLNIYESPNIQWQIQQVLAMTCVPFMLHWSVRQYVGEGYLSINGRLRSYPECLSVLTDNPKEDQLRANLPYWLYKSTVPDRVGIQIQWFQTAWAMQWLCGILPPLSSPAVVYRFHTRANFRHIYSEAVQNWYIGLGLNPPEVLEKYKVKPDINAPISVDARDDEEFLPLMIGVPIQTHGFTSTSASLISTLTTMKTQGDAYLIEINLPIGTHAIMWPSSSEYELILPHRAELVLRDFRIVQNDFSHVGVLVFDLIFDGVKIDTNSTPPLFKPMI